MNAEFTQIDNTGRVIGPTIYNGVLRFIPPK